MTYENTFRIAADHPALAGHFPGRPITPGVVLLNVALSHAEQWLGRTVHVESLLQSKFTSPLLPEHDAQLRLTLTGDDLRFTITRDEAPIAQGVFRLRPSPQ